MNYDEMRAMEKTHVCSECGGELVTIWDDENECSRLCCGVTHSHNGFQRKLSVTEVIKRGELDKHLGPGAQKDLEERAKQSQAALSLLPRQDIATNRALELAEIEGLVSWGEQIELNARLGHVCLYHGKPYVTIDGYYYLFNKKRLPLTIGSRPMNEEERKAYEIGEGDFAYICQTFAKGKALETVGIGIVTKDEIDEPSKRKEGEFNAPVVHSHPQRMAEKRAEWQLLRKLIPLEVKE